MKIALLGATGFVGSAILNEALNRGHMVTSATRDWAPTNELAFQLRGDLWQT